MPKEWETQLPASATAQLIHIWRGHPLPCGNRGDPRLHRWTNRSRSSSRREEGREIVERESYEAYKTYSELLDQAHKHYCGSVQMPGHLDEHWDHLNSSQSFDYWSELCWFLSTACVCVVESKAWQGMNWQQSRLALAFTLTHPVLWHHTAFLEWEFWEETLCAACQMGLRGF